SNDLFFWFFPSTNPTAQTNKEILIYLTGGPGCSSMGELLQLNGPLSWQPGTLQPIPNAWSWHRLTNVVWIDQPVGTGFVREGVKATAMDDEDVAEQFLGFWENFVEVFALQGFKVFVTASSYGGMYAPFISSAMLDRGDKTVFDVKGMAVWDGLMSKIPLTEDVPVARFVEKWKTALPLNDTFRAGVQAIDQQCGYSAYLDEFLVFPPKGPQPATLPGENPVTGLAKPECALYIGVFLAAREVNPCLNAFDITSRCPILFDPIGFSSGTLAIAPGFPTPYFDLPAVKAALHADPNTTWTFCRDPTANPVFAPIPGTQGPGVDLSLNRGPGSQAVIPRVIDATQNVILGHGARDFLVLPDATLLTIQNLTWQGQLGFQAQPTEPLFVPYFSGNGGGDRAALGSVVVAGSGVVGTSHRERGLTVEGFESTEPFTVDVSAGVGGGQPASQAAQPQQQQEGPQHQGPQQQGPQQPMPGTLGLGTVKVGGTVGYGYTGWKGINGSGYGGGNMGGVV
ncbi:Alpha/Beta hydrolase protein, partial [Chaetomium sp. MPI-SDFR-AT-0129]